MHTRHALIGLTLMALLAWATRAHADGYVPTRPGDVKVFRAGRGAAVTEEVDRTSGGWSHLSRLGGLGPLWVWRSASSERVYLWSEEGGTCELLSDFRQEPGYQTRIDLGPCNRGTVTLAERELTVEVPAGQFPGCVRLELETSCPDGGMTDAWLAPSVGIVRWREQTVAGPVIYELVSGTVGGVTYPTPSGVEIVGRFQGSTVPLGSRPDEETAPPAATRFRAGMTLTNHDAQDLRLYFPTGQAWDIEVVCAQGKVVSSWARGALFSMGPSQRTLRAGESWRFTGVVELTDSTRKPLAPGAYTVRVVLLGAPAGSTDAELPFQVSAPLAIVAGP